MRNEKQREYRERNKLCVYPRCCSYAMKRVYEYRGSRQGKVGMKSIGWRCSHCFRFIDEEKNSVIHHSKDTVDVVSADGERQ